MSAVDGNMQIWNGLTVQHFRDAAKYGGIHDEDNPLFLFALTGLPLLRAIADGKIDAMVLAKLELKNRGLD